MRLPSDSVTQLQQRPPPSPAISIKLHSNNSPSRLVPLQVTIITNFNNNNQSTKWVSVPSTNQVQITTNFGSFASATTASNPIHLSTAIVSIGKDPV
mmetsp:Transcript_10249/g.21959  ORF Transcript_10249/g.21959 Transcript_10249/m.21959 type:complete len:97 (+) Transcript_10249:570-860(+)|eukprot:CAMPEP_0171421236 /NCGR_PEP_ID=MMETSP0881-20121228/493_1 /TAXON_ID=67004 /ORGANISM="Thalassiosira weissflogii, Strain CCMP1336" /LENGTH=96 /DNA_ID=CAMNT_0011939647 /DNA_START=510 /DNA_END=800 /DNA_ORIENTATION=+